MLSARDAGISLETGSENAAAVDAWDLRVDPKSPLDDNCLYPGRQAPAVDAGHGLASPSGLEMTPFFTHFYHLCAGELVVTCLLFSGSI